MTPFSTVIALGRLVGFHGISTILGYLMPYPFYTYASYIHDMQTHFDDNMLKKSLN